MKKKILNILTFCLILTMTCGCGSKTSQTPESQTTNNENAWLITEDEHPNNYPYTVNYLSCYCKDSAVWLEDVEGNKYALNGLAMNLLKNEKNYKGTTNLILKKNKSDLYTPEETLKICMPVTYENYHQE